MLITDVTGWAAVDLFATVTKSALCALTRWANRLTYIPSACGYSAVDLLKGDGPAKSVMAYENLVTSV